MGRKAKFDEKVQKKGSTKKGKIRDEPIVVAGVKGMFINLIINYIQLKQAILFLKFIKNYFNHFVEKKQGKLSHRQLQRVKKRLLKKQNKNAKKLNKKKNDTFEEHSFDDSDHDDDTVTKNNKKRQLKNDDNAVQSNPKKIKKLESAEPKLQLFKKDVKDKGQSVDKGLKKLKTKAKLNNKETKVEKKEKKPKIIVERFIEESDEETVPKNVSILII